MGHPGPKKDRFHCHICSFFHVWFSVNCFVTHPTYNAILSWLKPISTFQNVLHIIAEAHTLDPCDNWDLGAYPTDWFFSGAKVPKVMQNLNISLDAGIRGSESHFDWQAAIYVFWSFGQYCGKADDDEDPPYLSLLSQSVDKDQSFCRAAAA